MEACLVETPWLYRDSGTPADWLIYSKVLHGDECKICIQSIVLQPEDFRSDVSIKIENLNLVEIE